MKMTVENLGHPTSNRFHEMNRDELVSINKSDLRRLTGAITGMQRKRQKTEQDLADIVYQMQKENLRDYGRILDNYWKAQPIAPT